MGSGADPDSKCIRGAFQLLAAMDHEMDLLGYFLGVSTCMSAHFKQWVDRSSTYSRRRSKTGFQRGIWTASSSMWSRSSEPARAEDALNRSGLGSL